jgi:hypothetical protein
LPLLSLSTKTTTAVDRQLSGRQLLLMEAAVDGSNGDGVFATTVDANDGMVAVTSTPAA